MIYADTPVPHFRFEHLSRYADRVSHLVSTRLGHQRTDFTVGLNGYCPADEVLSNRAELAQMLGLKLTDLVFAQQVHGRNVALVGCEHRGAGAFQREQALIATDGMVTNCAGVGLVALAADCVPLLMYDPVRHVAASVHSGWRGTVARIAQRAVEVMAEHHGCNPADLLVGIGPSIGACCYEVGPDVAQQIKQAVGVDNKVISDIIIGSADGKPHVNLWEANRHLLIQSGIMPENIEVAGICTRCCSDTFFSARTGDEGRFGAFIALR